MILDANCIGVLEPAGARAKLRSNFRVADLEVCPSEINVLEALRHENPRVRDRLLDTIAAFAAGRALLPWPYEILKQVGEAILRNEDELDVPPGDPRLRRILYDRASVTPAHVQAAKDSLLQREAQFSEMHERARAVFQPRLRELGAVGNSSVREFLDHRWRKPDYLAILIRDVWTALGLPSPAPVEQVLVDEAWMLFFDGWGAAAFERGISKKQPRRVEEADLLQLVYMGGAYRRILVTRDTGLHRVASEILPERYPRSRVLTVAELLEG